MVIFNVGHSGLLITTHYLGSTRCYYKIRNINGLNIIPWISYLNNLRKRSDTEAAKDRRMRGIAQKPKVIRKFNESWEKNRSWLLFK